MNFARSQADFSQIFVFNSEAIFMKIIIVGCGKIGASIANELNTDENNIVVVDINSVAVRNLAESLDIMGVEGPMKFLLRQELRRLTFLLQLQQEMRLIFMLVLWRNLQAQSTP